MKTSNHPFKHTITIKNNSYEEIFRKEEVFDRPSKIYETETGKYIIYISLSKIY